ncbi:MAG: PAS domain S-box protein [Candidatus Cloacimonetes bacterium]|nr:PAS domain S-box protein [Candidatus Cloacimonadota bacterium]
MRETGIIHQRHTSVWLYTLVLAAMSLFWASPVSCDLLTEAERDWVDGHGEIIFVSQTTYPPFEFIDSHGNHEGMCIELARWISTELGFKASFCDMTFQEAQEAVLSGEVDVLTSLFYSEERDGRFDFSEMTWEVPALIFVLAERPDITCLDDLQGKRVAMQRGDYAAEFLDSNGICYELVPTATFAEATDLVISGEADAVIGDEQIVLHHLFSNGLCDRVKSVGEPLYVGQNCMGVREGQTELRNILNKGIEYACQRGVFDRITQKWLGKHYALHSSWMHRHGPDILIALVVLAVFATLVVAWSLRLQQLVARRTRELVETHDPLISIVRHSTGRIGLKRWILVAVIMLPLLLVCGYVLKQYVIMPSFYALEQEQAKTSIAGCVDALQREAYHLGQVGGDWAMWDDTYQFVQDGNSVYETSNFQWESMHNSGIHLLYVCDLEGNVIWGGVRCPSYDADISLVEFPQDALPVSHPLLRHESLDSSINGFVLTEHGPMLVSSHPILTSLGEGPSRGTIIMGRFLDEVIIQELSHQYGIFFSVRNQRTSELKDSERAIFARLNNETHVIEAFDTDTLMAYGMLTDLEGNTALLVSASFGRRIVQRGLAMSSLVMLILLITGGILSVFLVSWLTSFLAESVRRQVHIEALVEERTSALRESEERYRDFFNNALVGLFRSRLSDGVFIEVNHITAKYLKLPVEEIVGKLSSADLYRNPGQRDELLSILERDGEVHGFETDMRFHDGAEGIFSSSVKAYPEMDYMEGAVLDITVRKRAEEDVKIFRTMSDMAMHGSAIVDLDGNMKYVNAFFAKIHGFIPDELIGRNLSVFHSEKQMKRTAQLNDSLIKKGHYSATEVWHIHKDGTEFPMLMTGTLMRDESGSPQYITAIAVDITERKRVEEALRKIHNDLQATLNAIPDIMFEVDPEGRIYNFNAPSEKSLHVPPEEFMGKTVNEVMPEEAAKIIMDAIAQAREKGSCHGAVYSLDTSEGEKWFELSISCRECNGSGYERLIALVRDITDRKRVEEALRESEERYRAFFDNSLVGLFRSRLSDGMFIDVNHKAAEDQGLRVEDIIGKVRTPDLYRDSERRDELFALLARDGEVNNFEIDMTHPAGNDVTFSISVKAYPEKDFLEGAVLDITARKQAEEALRESEERYHSFINTSTDLMFVKDEKSRYIVANKATLEFFGTSRDELLGGTGFELMDEVGARYCAASDKQVLEMLQVAVVEEPLNDRVYEMTKFPLKLSEGVIGIGGIGRDITARKRAEEALRESEERMELALRGADLGTWDLNIETGDVTHNERWAEMLGYILDEIEPDSTTWGKLTHPDDLPGIEAALNAHLAGKTVFYETEHRLRHKSGEWVWVLDRGQVIERALDGKPLRACGTHLDITERKQAEEERERLKLAIEQASEMIVITDVRSVIQYVNPAFEHVTGYSSDEAIGQDTCILESGEHDPSQYTEMWKTLETGESWSGQFINKKKDGTLYTVEAVISPVRDALGRTVSYVAVERDITERKLAEEERERLMLAIEQASEVIEILDVEGVIQYVNPAFERISGYTRDAVIGKNIRDLRSGEHDDAFNQELWEKLVCGETWSGRFVSKKKDGKLYTEEAVISPVRDASGKIVNYVTVKRDITEELKLTAQLQQAQKMESVGRLAGGVAHDFNNMLLVILGHTELLLDQMGPNDPLRSNIEEIRNAGNRSADLTRQLLAFARKQTVSPVVLDLNKTVDSMLKMLRRLIGEDIDLIWKPGEGIAPVRIDPAQVDQMLANLAVNSRDAIEDVGTLTIETANFEIDDEFCERHAGFKAGYYAMLAVTDTGCGMSKEVQSHIFEPFFTTKTVGEGTGLGLATLYGVVKQNKGFVSVYSELGKGTAFKIFLPACGDREKDAVQEVTFEAIDGGGETVLLVEDEPAILKMGATMLEHLGYSVLKAHTPGEALQIAREHPGNIDVLLTDVVMPEMNGRELAKRLLALYPTIKRLFMSGYTANVIAHQGVLDEGVHFLQKPFSFKTLAEKLKEALHNE